MRLLDDDSTLRVKTCNLLQTEGAGGVYAPACGPGVPQQQLLDSLCTAADYHERDGVGRDRDDMRKRPAYVHSYLERSQVMAHIQRCELQALRFQECRTSCPSHPPHKWRTTCEAATANQLAIAWQVPPPPRCMDLMMSQEAVAANSMMRILQQMAPCCFGDGHADFR